jgi:UDP-3-O-[3-hydroxymyristoyl] glucosamine N-acyltransferase
LAEEAGKTWTLGELAQMMGGELRGPQDLPISRPVPAGSDDPEGITFATNEGYMRKALDSSVGAIIVPLDCPPLDRPAVAVKAPRSAFGVVLSVFEKPLSIASGIHEKAVVDPSAVIHPTASIGAYVVIERDTVIEEGVEIFPFAFVGPRCRIGAGCKVLPHAVLVQDVELGRGCLIHPGAILGADGFGFAWTGSEWFKIPQVGVVVIGENVEIGVNTAVDRATCGETVLGDGVKIDNLVQIAHNVKVGEYTIIVGQVGIAGSTEIGKRNQIGGQSAFADHITTSDDSIFGGASRVTSDLPSGEYMGYPAGPARSMLRAQAMVARLPEMMSRLRQLERELEALKRDGVDPEDAAE